MSRDMPGLPAPSLTSITAPYWEAAGAGRLSIQRCGSCGVDRHPPTAVCYSCGSFDIEWVEHDGLGHVYSFIWTHRPVVPAFGHLGVYNVSVVELEATSGDEPVRILSRVDGVDEQSLQVGLDVAVAFDPIDDPRADGEDPPIGLPVFRPRAED